MSKRLSGAAFAFAVAIVLAGGVGIGGQSPPTVWSLTLGDMVDHYIRADPAHVRTGRIPVWVGDPPTLPPLPASPLQIEDVVPIAGDSAPPTDEVMEARVEPPRWWLAPRPGSSADGSHSFRSFLTGPIERIAAPTAPTSPLVFFTGLRDGIVDMRIVSDHALTHEELQRYTTGEAVLIALPPSSRHDLAKQLAAATKKGSGAHVTHVKLAAYCVEAQKPQPPSDAMFIVANSVTRDQFASMRTVRQVAELARTHGFLKPDSDPASYGRFVTQYAIWSKVEHWDQARFTDEFVARTKGVYEAQHKTWTADVDSTLRVLAPNRWREIEGIIGVADRVDRNTRAARAGGVE